MKQTMRLESPRAYRVVLAFLLCVAVLGSAGNAAAQQKDKKNKKDAPEDTKGPVVPLGDEQQIDYQISTMLGAWQLGDVERMRQTYADDVIVVSGVYAPPVIGWANYAPLYQQQRSRMQQVRMDRFNTVIKIFGNFAWACYQWDFSASIDGQTSGSQGQATLVFEKRDGHWLIVHNHTSLVQPSPPSPGNAPPAASRPASTPSPH
jgi:ketosteroid isomerase-like protein